MPRKINILTLGLMFPLVMAAAAFGETAETPPSPSADTLSETPLCIDPTDEPAQPASEGGAEAPTEPGLVESPCPQGDDSPESRNADGIVQPLTEPEAEAENATALLVGTNPVQDQRCDNQVDAPDLLDINVLAQSTTQSDAADVNSADSLLGPDAVQNQLRDDRADSPDLLEVDLLEGWRKFKAGVKEDIGLDFGFDYNALGFLATDSLGDNGSASGAFRFYGSWELIERNTPNTGSLVFKIENRHSYTDVAPTDFGFELGYDGLPNSVFSDQGWRATHLYWQQEFANGRGVGFIGVLDITDYTDVYALASPWTGFSNLAFQTGSGTIGGLPDGALGAMVGGFPSKHVYVVGSIADANADATDILGGFDTFFNEFETFKTLEIGWTPTQKLLFVDNAHLTFWQIDSRQEAGTPDGWGLNFSASGAIDNSWLVFLRGGWAQDGGSLFEGSISAGFGYQGKPGRDLLGVGLNWSKPNSDTFGPGLESQFTAELFQRLDITEAIQVTPSVQVIVNPALNPDNDAIGIFGLRTRIIF